MSAPIHTVVLGLSAVTAIAAIGVLLLIGLGLIAYLVHRRLITFGSDVRRLQRDVHELKEDLRKVYAARAAVVVKEPAPPPPVLPPPPPAPTPVVVDLSWIEDSLAEVRAMLAELSDRSREREQAPEPAPPPPAPPAKPGVTVRERIEARFRHAGFEVVRILSGDVDREWIDGEPVRIPLEGRRRGATYKGHVMVSGDQVVDEKMTSSHEAFP